MVSFVLNGQPVEIDVPSDASLLNVLSLDLNQHGPKYGCGMAQCGACTVHIDGDAVFSCQMEMADVSGRKVTTLVGLLEDGQANALQQAMIKEQAAQCGYCSSGMIMKAQELLNQNPTPTEAEVRTHLDGNLCRCGSHNRIVRAVLRAAEEG